MAKTSKKDKRAHKAKITAMVVAEAIQKGQELSKAEILRRAGYAPSVVARGATGSGSPWTADEFRRGLIASGLGPDVIHKVVEEAAGAKVVSNYRGEVIESDVPDHAIRLKSAQFLADLHGVRVRRTESKSVNINLDADQAAELLDL